MNVNHQQPTGASFAPVKAEEPVATPEHDFGEFSAPVE